MVPLFSGCFVFSGSCAFMVFAHSGDWKPLSILQSQVWTPEATADPPLAASQVWGKSSWRSTSPLIARCSLLAWRSKSLVLFIHPKPLSPKPKPRAPSLIRPETLLSASSQASSLHPLKPYHPAASSIMMCLCIYIYVYMLLCVYIYV